MSVTEHKRVFRRLIDEGFNGGRLAVLDELLTADFVDHSPCRPLRGATGLRECIALLRFALPDLHLCVDDMAAADECLGFSRIDTCRYVDGQIAEYWSETADLMKQLGISVT